MAVRLDEPLARRGWRHDLRGGPDAADERNDSADKFGWAYLAGGAYFFGLMHAVIPAPGRLGLEAHPAPG